MLSIFPLSADARRKTSVKERSILMREMTGNERQINTKVRPIAGIGLDNAVIVSLSLTGGNQE